MTICEKKVRLDKWLWAARFFKTRSLAKDAIEGGKVHCGGQRVKVAKEIASGDVLFGGAFLAEPEVFVAQQFRQAEAVVNLRDADFRARVRDADLAGMRLVKERYYELLFSGCRNQEIRRALENIIDRVYYLRGRLMSDPNRRATSVLEMQRLTTALIARDRLAARAASLAHLAAARDAVLDAMAQNLDQSDSGG